MPAEALLTTAEAAARLGVPVWVIHNHRRAGRLVEVTKVGRTTGPCLYRPEDIDALREDGAA